MTDDRSEVTKLTGKGGTRPELSHVSQHRLSALYQLSLLCVGETRESTVTQRGGPSLGIGWPGGVIKTNSILE